MLPGDHSVSLTVMSLMTVSGCAPDVLQVKSVGSHSDLHVAGYAYMLKAVGVDKSVTLPDGNIARF